MVALPSGHFGRVAGRCSDPNTSYEPKSQRLCPVALSCALRRSHEQNGAAEAATLILRVSIVRIGRRLMTPCSGQRSSTGDLKTC